MSVERKGSIGPGTLRVGRNIRALRTERKLSMREFVALLAEHGYKTQTSEISNVETGSRGISVDMLLAYAEALDVTAAQLLEEDCSAALRASGVAALVRAGVPAEAAQGAYDRGVRA